MPEPLTDEDMAELRELAEAGDRVGYYGVLEEHGYRYGGLARGVVTADQVPGRTANNFFEARAAEQIEEYNELRGVEQGEPGWVDPEISKTKLAELSQDLMERDLQAREDFREAYPERAAAGERLPVEDVQAYHAEAFSETFADILPELTDDAGQQIRPRGISIDAWTPHRALEAQGPSVVGDGPGEGTLDEVRAADAEREALWDTMLDDWRRASPESLVSDGGEYARQQTAAGAKAVFGQEGEVGPYRIDTPDGAGEVVAGTPGHDPGPSGERGFTLGTEGNDVVYTFTGHDSIMAGGGNDRVYAGAGRDLLVLGTGDDIAYPGEGEDLVQGGEGADTLSYRFDTPTTESSTGLYVGDPVFEVTVDGTTMTATAPTVVIGQTVFQDTDRAVEMERYEGSPVSDVVTVESVTTDLYLDGGRGEDTLRGDFPEGSTVSYQGGVVTEGIHANLDYDGVINLPDGQSVYFINFENTELGEIERVTGPDEDMHRIVPTDDAILEFSRDREALAADPGAQADVVSAAFHPEAEAMMTRLYQSEDTHVELAAASTVEGRVIASLQGVHAGDAARIAELESREMQGGETAREAEARAHSEPTNDSWHHESAEDDYGVYA